MIIPLSDRSYGILWLTALTAAMQYSPGLRRFSSWRHCHGVSLPMHVWGYVSMIHKTGHCGRTISENRNPSHIFAFLGDDIFAIFWPNFKTIRQIVIPCSMAFTSLLVPRMLLEELCFFFNLLSRFSALERELDSRRLPVASRRLIQTCSSFWGDNSGNFHSQPLPPPPTPRAYPKLSLCPQFIYR